RAVLPYASTVAGTKTRHWGVVRTGGKVVAKQAGRSGVAKVALAVAVLLMLAVAIWVGRADKAEDGKRGAPLNRTAGGELPSAATTAQPQARLVPATDAAVATATEAGHALAIAPRGIDVAVQDLAGRPIAGAEVWFLPDGNTLEAVTDSEHVRVS